MNMNVKCGPNPHPFFFSILVSPWWNQQAAEFSNPSRSQCLDSLYPTYSVEQFLPKFSPFFWWQKRKGKLDHILTLQSLALDCPSGGMWAAFRVFMGDILSHDMPLHKKVPLSNPCHFLLTTKTTLPAVRGFEKPTVVIFEMISYSAEGKDITKVTIRASNIAFGLKRLDSAIF